MIKTIITYPHLNDCKGDVSKQWYVEYIYQIPGETKKKRKRTYVSGTEIERRNKAYKIIQQQTEMLQAGNLYEPLSKVLITQTERTEVQNYNDALKKLVSPINRKEDFLAYKAKIVSAKSMETYKGRINEFANYCDALCVSTENIDRKIILEFLYTIENKGLARLTIEKYVQIIRAYFEWEIDQGNITNNPVKRIPKLGRVIDNAPSPIAASEREYIKNAIKDNDPWLWLACEMQYYCAIRPGTELRLLQIKDINFDRKQIRINATNAKNNKSEIVNVPTFLVQHIKKMVVGYDPKFYIFGSEGVPGPTPLGKNTMRNRFNRYRDALGISSDIKFYSWKHSGAISAIDAGMQPYQLQKHLRHKSFDTTEKYLSKRTPLNIDIDNFHTPI